MLESRRLDYSRFIQKFIELSKNLQNKSLERLGCTNQLFISSRGVT